MRRLGLTATWILYVAVAVAALLNGPAASGPFAIVTRVWLDNAAFVVGAAAVLTILVVVAWLSPRVRS